MKILDQGEYAVTRIPVPPRPPSTPTGSIKLVGTLRNAKDVAFFHADANGVVWRSHAGRNFRQQHLHYTASVDTFMATVFNSGWYSRGLFKWSAAYKPVWLDYIAKRAKVTSSGFTNF